MLLIGRGRLRSIVDQPLLKNTMQVTRRTISLEGRSSKLIAQSSGNLSSHGRSSSLEGWRLYIILSLDPRKSIKINIGAEDGLEDALSPSVRLGEPSTDRPLS